VWGAHGVLWNLEGCKVAWVQGLGVGGYLRKDRTAKGIIIKE
jgi:hypothetical protein